MHIPQGLDVLNEKPGDMQPTFNILNKYLFDNGGTMKITNSEDGTSRVKVITWPTKEACDKFHEFSKSVTNYTEFYNSYVALIESYGGTITRTEEKI